MLLQTRQAYFISGLRFITSEAVLKKSKSQPIIIPQRINRSPTDLLMALSSTVGDDPTAAHYAFVDDPAMIPSQRSMKRQNFLVKEFGKRAAIEIASEWPTLFMYDRDSPRLEAFRPSRLPPVENIEPKEENLLKLMQVKRINDAISLYDRIRSEKIDISPTTLLDLFEMLVFYNNDDPPDFESSWPGLRSYGQINVSEIAKDNHVYQLKHNGMADEIYKMLIDKESNSPFRQRIDSVMIAGLCKFDQSTRKAFEIAEKMRTNGQIPSEEAYLGLFSRCESTQEIRQLFERLVADNVCPTLPMFNAALRRCEKLNMQARDSVDSNAYYRLMKKIFAEILVVGLQPSLSSYLWLLSALNRDKRRKEFVNYTAQIFDELEKRAAIQLVEWDDFQFFTKIMSLLEMTPSLSLAQRLFALYNCRENEVQLPTFDDENTFFGRYLKISLAQCSFEEFIRRYKSLVPRYYSLDEYFANDIYELLMARIMHLNSNVKLFERRKFDVSFAVYFIEELITSQFIVNKNASSVVLPLLLKATSDVKVEFLLLSILYHLQFKTLSTDDHRSLFDQLNHLIDLITYQVRRKNSKRLWFPKELSQIAVLLMRFGRHSEAKSILEILLPQKTDFSGTTDTLDEEEAKKLDKSLSVIADIGHPDPKNLHELIDKAILDDDFENSCYCLEIQAYYFPNDTKRLVQIADQMNRELTLNDFQKRVVKNFVQLRRV